MILSQDRFHGLNSLSRNDVVSCEKSAELYKDGNSFCEIGEYIQIGFTLLSLEQRWQSKDGRLNLIQEELEKFHRVSELTLEC